MDSTLKNIVQVVQQNPENPESWKQLATHAFTIENWKISISAYLANFSLEQPTSQDIENFILARQNFIQTLNIDNQFHCEVFKLPQKKCVVMLLGIMNTAIDTFKHSMHKLMDKDYKFFILDFTGLEYISGLGPSCIKNLNLRSQNNNCFFALANVSDKVNNMLQLKSVTTQQYSDVLEILTEKKTDE